MKSTGPMMAFMLLASASAGLAHADASLGISPFTQSVTTGQTFNFDVDIAGASNVYAYQFDVSYDPTLVAALTSSQGGFLSGAGSTFFIPGTIDNLNGSVLATSATLIGAIPGAAGSGSLAQFTFQALGSGLSLIALSGVQLLDSAFNPIGSSTQNGSVVVTSSGSVQAPEIDPASGTGAGVLLIAGMALLASRRRDPLEMSSQKSR